VTEHVTTPSSPAAVPTWERRFRAPRVGLPDWADDAPHRCAVKASAGGVVEIHSWEPGGELIRATCRPEGTSCATIDPAGQWLWWFDDTSGDEFGVWRRQLFGSGPAAATEDATGLPAAYPAGLALGRDGLVVVGRSNDAFGTEIHVIVPGEPAPRLLYSHSEDAGVTALSKDGTLVAISHSEHGDSRHPQLRVVGTDDGSTIADLWDGPGRGVEALGFSPVDGDPRLLVLHERHGRGELLIWDAITGEQRELDLTGKDLAGEISFAEWFHDARSLLVGVDHEARTTLLRVGLGEGSVSHVGPSTGTVLAATARPDGSVWTLWSSAAEPPAVRDLDGTLVLAAGGETAPGSVPVEDVWVEGPGGRIHALLRRPAGPDGAAPRGPLPLVVEVHGGPTAHDTDAFRPYPAAWVDHGYAVVQVNYRGSTGYGSAWRDALESRVGHVELEDIVAVRDHLVDTGLADGDRVILAGASWGGFLTLLGLGIYPDRWAAGLAGVPVADYVAAYEDEMESLKAFDRSLFGGSPQEAPDRYRESSPLTYVDAVRAPVLVLAGENDPRCPIRQIENYLTALAGRGVPHEVYRFDAGHGSLVDDERIRQMRAELDFAARHAKTLRAP
jgi:dienelactone hydrolase